MSSNEPELAGVTKEGRSPPDDVSRSLSSINDVRQRKSNIDELVRVFLALSTVLFVILAFLAFFVSRNVLVLLGSTIVGIAVTLVFTYYFKR